MDWADVPTWLAALFGGAAALVVSWQLRILVRDRESEQASKFAMWAQFAPRHRVMTLFHSNTGAAPVYDVRGFVIIDGRKVGEFERGTLGPTATQSPWEQRLDLIEAAIRRQLRDAFGDDVDVKDRYGNEDLAPEIIPAREDLYASVKIEVTFRDSHGVAWLREPDGTLVKLRNQRQRTAPTKR